MCQCSFRKKLCVTFFFSMKFLCSRGVIQSHSSFFLSFSFPTRRPCFCYRFFYFDGSLRLYYKVKADALWESQRNQISVISEHKQIRQNKIVLPFCFYFCSKWVLLSLIWSRIMFWMQATFITLSISGLQKKPESIYTRPDASLWLEE